MKETRNNQPVFLIRRHVLGTKELPPKDCALTDKDTEERRRERENDIEGTKLLNVVGFRNQPSGTSRLKF